MPRSRTYQTEALIIKKTKLGEADHILTLYTPDLGKIRVVARGIRRAKSKMAGHLELVTESQILLARGHTLDIITGGQTIESFVSLKNDLELSSYALYTAELVDQFTVDNEPGTAVFHLLRDFWHRLRLENDNELDLLYFEMQILDATGYRPQLEICTVCHRDLSPVPNAFSPYSGGVICPECATKQPYSRSITVNALKVLRFLQNQGYDTIARLKLPQALSLELNAILRGYLRYLLERELKSAAWLDELRAPLTPSPEI
jgi:DNA repair protein RecO (recombination protein O)